MNSTNIYDSIATELAMKYDVISEEEIYEETSKELNKYGIKGKRYIGEEDGECAVIFDDKAIDIITKFRQEEGKWKSEKINNARNREADKEKAQRKLEKHNNKLSEKAQHNKQILEKAFPGRRF